MLTRTLPSPDHPISRETVETPEYIEQTVKNRGFYLYEWISPDELRMSIEGDYLTLIQKLSIPLAIVTVIAGMMGLAGGWIGVILATLTVLGFFYGFILIILMVKMVHKSYLYMRGGSVVITDKHYMSNGKVVGREDFSEQRVAFSSLEKTFREPLLEPSGLSAHIAIEKQNLFARLKDIALGGGKIIQNIGRSRDAGGIILVLMIAGVLYGGMMALVYVVGIFLVSLMARIFASIAHRALLITQNREHVIQTLFTHIDMSSDRLQSQTGVSRTFLEEASQNAWKDNLSEQIHTSLENISTLGADATDKVVELRKLLSTSLYRDIFNFDTYNRWVKQQVLIPLEQIFLLLEKNRAIIVDTLAHLDTEITRTTDAALQNPLILQKERLEIHLKSLEQNSNLIQSYISKLT